MTNRKKSHENILSKNRPTIDSSGTPWNYDKSRNNMQ